jgi:hypothetical protein
MHLATPLTTTYYYKTTFTILQGAPRPKHHALRASRLAVAYLEAVTGPNTLGVVY